MARLEQERREAAYRFYIADSIRAIPQHKWLETRLIDILREKREETDTRSAQEIAEDIVKKAGLILGTDV